MNLYFFHACSFCHHSSVFISVYWSKKIPTWDDHSWSLHGSRSSIRSNDFRSCATPWSTEMAAGGLRPSNLSRCFCMKLSEAGDFFKKKHENTRFHLVNSSLRKEDSSSDQAFAILRPRQSQKNNEIALFSYSFDRVYENDWEIVLDFRFFLMSFTDGFLRTNSRSFPR